MRTILWLGAHKTGTTFLQNSLELSARALYDRGVAYMELSEFRRRYTRPLLRERPSGRLRHPDHVSVVDPATRLVFDENIPGLVQHAVSKRALYPNLEPRVARIVDQLELSVDEVVIGIRSYDQFVPSVYCEALKSTPFRTFDSYLAQALSEPANDGREATIHHDARTFVITSLDWYKLATRVAAALPEALVTIYLHEELRGREALLLSQVLGIPQAEISLLPRVERVGFSQEAIRRLVSISQERAVVKADVALALLNYPVGDDFSAYHPWDDSSRKVLKEHYKDHTERIRANGRLQALRLG